MSEENCTLHITENTKGKGKEIPAYIKRQLGQKKISGTISGIFLECFIELHQNMIWKDFFLFIFSVLDLFSGILYNYGKINTFSLLFYSYL